MSSTPMWDALESFLDRGGRLMYLGGNGFFWRIAYHPTIAGVMELRRAEDGSRPWEAEPGEYYMSFNGEYGGLWRRVGRPPQHACSASASPLRASISLPITARTADSRDPRARASSSRASRTRSSAISAWPVAAPPARRSTAMTAARVATARAGRRALGGPHRGDDGRQGGHAGTNYIIGGPETLSSTPT